MSKSLEIVDTHTWNFVILNKFFQSTISFCVKDELPKNKLPNPSIEYNHDNHCPDRSLPFPFGSIMAACDVSKKC